MNAIGTAHTTDARRVTGFIVVVAALAGLMFGLDVGVIAGATQFIQHEFHINDHAIEMIVSSMMAGAACGALMASPLSARLGRKRLLMIGATVFIIGSIFSASSATPAQLIAARFVFGLSIGVLSFTAPLYVAEIAPRERRGAMISCYQLMITIGILAAFVSDLALSYSGNWRLMLGVIAIPGAVFLVGVLALPDSPRWLLMRGRPQEATRVLAHLRGNRLAARQELAEIEEQLLRPQQGWRMFIGNGNFRRSVWLGILLQLMQQFTGMNVVMYYAPRIFRDMGYATAEQMWFTALVGLINVLATFVAIGLVDRWGRKPILYVGFAVMAFGLGAVATMMHLAVLSHGQQLFTVAMLLVFIIGFAMSAGPLIWVLCSEVQPLKGRDFGIGCSTVTNWIANMVVGATFLSLLHGIGRSGTFWLYAALNVVFLLLTTVLVPETRGITLEQIESNLMAGRRLRHIGR